MSIIFKNIMFLFFIENNFFICIKFNYFKKGKVIIYVKDWLELFN